MTSSAQRCRLIIQMVSRLEQIAALGDDAAALAKYREVVPLIAAIAAGN